jgi:predicted transcriptional regulator
MLGAEVHVFHPSSTCCWRGCREPPLIAYWIHKKPWQRCITMHTANCFMCNEGRGFVRSMIGHSQTAENHSQWYGPFPIDADAQDAAAALLAITPRAVVRECRRCKPGLGGVMAVADDGPAGLRYANPTGRTPVPIPNIPYWMKVVIKHPLRATIHLNFCGVVNRGRSATTTSHGTDVEASHYEAGWYGPYGNNAEARSAAVHVQQAGGLIRDCLQCFHASRRYRLRVDSSCHQRFEPEVGKPAVPVNQSVNRDHIPWLECGQRTQLLAIHLRRAHKITPNEYRAKWDIPDTYPMESDGYRRWRSRSNFVEHAGRDEPID